MITRSHKNRKGPMLCSNGSVLVYIVLAMVIFGILGVTMVSLFSTSISSSATQNDTRRAYQYYESGIRYGASELVNGSPKFSENIINRLNSTIYKVDTDSNFNIRIFRLNFASLSKLPDPVNPDPSPTISLKLDKGSLPDGFTIPTGEPRAFLVLKTADPGSDFVAEISGYTFQDDTHITLALEDNINIEKEKKVAFAVRPFQDDNISQGGNLLLARNAASLFPRKNGAIMVRSANLTPEDKFYFYDNRVDTENSNYIKLTNIQSKDGSGFPLDVSASSTYVISSPGVYIVTAKGESNGVISTEKWNNQYGGSVYDRTEVTEETPESREPDIEFDKEESLTRILSQIPDAGIVSVYEDPGDKLISLSTSGGSFGAFWFRDPDGRSIGGVRNFCNNLGGCLFNNGFRAFFILNFTGSSSGDGLAFSIVNGSNNTAGSIGGDIDLSELLAYAGDSRMVSNPTTPSDFLDNRADSSRRGDGLKAPKFAVEFDGLAATRFNTSSGAATTR